jgi:hypothetical protein
MNTLTMYCVHTKRGTPLLHTISFTKKDAKSKFGSPLRSGYYVDEVVLVYGNKK